MQWKKGELSFAAPLAALPLTRTFSRHSKRTELEIRIAGSQ